MCCISIVISAKQFDGGNPDDSSVEDEVFPVEGELVNYTTQFNPAQISIPRQVLLDALSVSGGSYVTTENDNTLPCYISCNHCITS